MATKFHGASLASNSERWINGKWTTVSKTTPVFVYDDGNGGGSWKVGSFTIQPPDAAATYFHEIQRCILSYSRCILLDPTLCQFNIIHYSQRMYLKPVLLLFYGLLLSFPYGNLSAQLPNATHPTHSILHHTLWRSLLAVMHLLQVHVFSYVLQAQQLNILVSLWKRLQKIKNSMQKYKTAFLKCILFINWTKMARQKNEMYNQKQICSCTNVSPQAWDCACPSDLPLHHHTSVPLMDLPAIQWHVTHNTRKTEYQTMKNKTSEH